MGWFAMPVSLVLDRNPDPRLSNTDLVSLAFLTFRVAQYVYQSHIFGLGM